MNDKAIDTANEVLMFFVIVAAIVLVVMHL